MDKTSAAAKGTNWVVIVPTLNEKSIIQECILDCWFYSFDPAFFSEVGILSLPRALASTQPSLKNLMAPVSFYPIRGIIEFNKNKSLIH
jgi:hypothetical protein